MPLARYSRVWFIVAALGLLAVVKPAFTADTYAVVDVATFEQPGGGRVRDINAAGEVVGTIRSGSRKGFRLSAFEPPNSSTRVDNLDGIAGTDASAANAISPLGAVAGASNSDNGIRAFLWTRKDGFQILVTLPGDQSSEALGINRHNDVVGYSSGPGGIEAVLWDKDGNIEALGRLAAGDYSRAYAINESGDIVGTSGRAGFTRAFFRTRQGQMEDLGALPGNDQSTATAVNNPGTVVGYSSGGLGDLAFVWSRGSGMMSLGTLPGGDFSRALDINESGDVVGVSDSPLGNRAVLWTQQGEIQDLNTRIPAGSNFVLREAISINSQGVILATGQDGGETSKQGHDHSRLEVPTRVVLLVP